MTTYDNWKTHDAAGEEQYAYEDFVDEIEEGDDFEQALRNDVDFWVHIMGEDYEAASKRRRELLDEVVASELGNARAL